jgi:hypothetical protein
VTHRIHSLDIVAGAAERDFSRWIVAGPLSLSWALGKMRAVIVVINENKKINLLFFIKTSITYSGPSHPSSL